MVFGNKALLILTLFGEMFLDFRYSLKMLPDQIDLDYALTTLVVALMDLDKVFHYSFSM